MIMIIVTTPSKQCKSLINVLILRQYLKNEMFVEDMKNGEGKYLFYGGGEKKEKEKEEIIWKRKLMVTPTDRPTYRVNIVLESEKEKTVLTARFLSQKLSG